MWSVFSQQLTKATKLVLLLRAASGASYLWCWWLHSVYCLYMYNKFVVSLATWDEHVSVATFGDDLEFHLQVCTCTWLYYYSHVLLFGPTKINDDVELGSCDTTCSHVSLTLSLRAFCVVIFCRQALSTAGFTDTCRCHQCDCLFLDLHTRTVTHVAIAIIKYICISSHRHTCVVCWVNH